MTELIALVCAMTEPMVLDDRVDSARTVLGSFTTMTELMVLELRCVHPHAIPLKEQPPPPTPTPHPPSHPHTETSQ